MYSAAASKEEGNMTSRVTLFKSEVEEGDPPTIGSSALSYFLPFFHLISTVCQERQHARLLPTRSATRAPVPGGV